MSDDLFSSFKEQVIHDADATPKSKASEEKKVTVVSVTRLWGNPRNGELLVRKTGTKEFRLLPASAVVNVAEREFKVEESLFESSPKPAFARS